MEGPQVAMKGETGLRRDGQLDMFSLVALVQNAVRVSLLLLSFEDIAVALPPSEA